MSVPQIQDEQQLKAALAAPRFLLFKHSLICPTSDRAFAQYEAYAADHPDTPTGWIDVIGQRAWSQEVARRTGVTHQSPQALWIVDGAVRWNASHSGITRDKLGEACAVE